MKPPWKDAPSWARYMAQDRDGTWTWFEYRPRKMAGRWWPKEGLAQVAHVPKWEASVEERP